MEGATGRPQNPNFLSHILIPEWVSMAKRQCSMLRPITAMMSNELAGFALSHCQHLFLGVHYVHLKILYLLIGGTIRDFTLIHIIKINSAVRFKI